MLQSICEHLHNYFVRISCYNTYSIKDGAISPLPDLKDGQRILIRGSDLNDGVYTWYASGINNDDDNASACLQDETFKGAICALSIPRGLEDLAKEIAEWQDKYGSVVNSPYDSENVIGVYGYTKKSGGESNGSGEVGWQTIYSKRLNAWRKACL